MTNDNAAMNSGDADSDRVKQLERIVDEMKVRDDDESARQKTADSKLTSALAVLPIIIALSTSAFIQILPYAARLGRVGVGIMALFFAGISCFVAAAIRAIYGLWPMRARYAAIGMGTLIAFVNEGSYSELLRKIIAERREVVRHNIMVNGRKLGDYACAARLTVIGLIVITVIVFAFVLAFAFASNQLLGINSPGPLPNASRASRASSCRSSRLLTNSAAQHGSSIHKR